MHLAGVTTHPPKKKQDQQKTNRNIDIGNHQHRIETDSIRNLFIYFFLIFFFCWKTEEHRKHRGPGWGHDPPAGDQDGRRPPATRSATKAALKIQSNPIESNFEKKKLTYSAGPKSALEGGGVEQTRWRTFYEAEVFGHLGGGGWGWCVCG